MKKSLLVFLLLAISSMLFNLSKIEWNKSLVDENSIAVIGVLASGCAFLLILILWLSIKISEKN
ncbi:MAG: hypothetical protein P8L83_05145 [Flavobacteriaceae bacterium]|nr:hypothetical protein [Flavobacteriaceae bacterium]